MDFDFKVFDSLKAKMALVVMIKTNKFPGIKRGWLFGALKWIRTLEAEEFLLDLLEQWEKNTPVEPEPDTEEVVIRNTGAKMSWNGGNNGPSELFDKFVFPKRGPDYTDKPFTIEFSDGNKLHIDNPTQMRMTPDNMKYQPGYPYTPDESIKTMEVYARRGTHPEWVKAVFKRN